MVTFEKKTDVHFNIFMYGLKIGSLAIGKDYYRVYMSHNDMYIPKTAKKCIKSIIKRMYEGNNKQIELHRYVYESRESLSIKKMMKILN